MDQQKIIHLAGETIVVVGLFLYLLRQIKSIQSEVSEIKETMIKQQQFIDKNFMAISKTIDFLSNRNKVLSNDRTIPSNTSQRVQSRPNKTRLNAVPLSSEDDEQINELMFPQSAGTIFVQTIQRQPIPITPQNNTDIVVLDDQSNAKEQSDILDDIDDISEELNQLQSSEESFSIPIEEIQTEIKNEEEQMFQNNEENEADKKSKRRKANLKTKK